MIMKRKKLFVCLVAVLSIPLLSSVTNFSQTHKHNDYTKPGITICGDKKEPNPISSFSDKPIRF